MKPLIGVLARPSKNESNKDVFSMNKEISDTILKFGGIPFLIIPTNIDEFFDNDHRNTKVQTALEFEDMKILLDKCDGVILQGGDNYYSYDINSVKYLHEKDIPTLGICLGMQSMSCAFEGTLTNITSFINHKQKDVKYVHDVIIDENSKLYDIFKEYVISVNSRHKSEVKNTRLNVAAYSTDGIIEAVEDKSKRFFVGVEWHPESMITYDVLAPRLFTQFIEICKKG